MISFGLFKRKPKEEPTRLLFGYWDGQKVRYADPFRLWRTLNSQTDVDIQAAAPMVDQGKEPETTQVIECLANVFGVQRWEGTTQTGLTDWEILNLLGDLDNYLLTIKKK